MIRRAFTSAGLLTLSAATLQAIYAPNLTRQEAAKPFTVSCAVQGFWDDNYLSAPTKTVVLSPSGLPVVEDLPRYASWGIQLTPQVEFNVPTERTLYSGGASMNYRWYENWQPPPNSADAGRPYQIDFSGQFALDHEFSENYKLRVIDILNYSDQPTYLSDFGQIITDPVVTEQGTYHNMGSIDFRGQLDPRNGFGVNYQNDFYSYTSSGPGSSAALLNRISQAVTLDYRRTFRPTLTGLLGYTFAVVNYTADELLYGGAPPNRNSAERDSRTQTFFAGGDWSITPLLYTSIRAGAQFTDYVNLDNSQVNPYLDASMTYNFMPRGTAQLGLRIQIAPSDRAYTQFTAINQNANPTVSSETYLPYLNVNYPITAKMTAAFSAQYQYGVYQGGQFDGTTETLLTLTLGLEYRINQFLALIGSYNFYQYDSDVQFSDYSRNQVLFGIRANY